MCLLTQANILFIFLSNPFLNKENMDFSYSQESLFYNSSV